MSSNDPYEPVTITDKRRVDPETGEVRRAARSGTTGAGNRAGPKRAGAGSGFSGDSHGKR